MSGCRWDNVVSGSKELIKHAKEYHIKPEDIQIVLIFFGSDARLVYNDNLGKDIPENVWTF